MNTALILLLAQTCVAEINFPSSTAECVAMWEINAREADRRNVDIVQHTHQFNTYWRSAKRQARKPWVVALAVDGSRPLHWPRRLSWAKRRGRWLRIVARATKFVAEYPEGRHRAVCRGADDYGSATIDGAPCPESIRVDCVPGSLQAYWNNRTCRDARRRRNTKKAPERG